MVTTIIQAKRTGIVSHFEEFTKISYKPTQEISTLTELKNCEIPFLNQGTDSKDSCLENRTSEWEKDTLPGYICTVSRKGNVLVRQETNEFGKISTDHKWRPVELSIEGTKVIMDHGSGSKRRPSLLASLGFNFSVNNSSNNPKELPNYSRSLPIEGAILSKAEEYINSNPYTFRISLTTGENLLIFSDSRRAAERWIDSLQSAIVISSDLDSRQEPNFSLKRIILFTTEANRII